MAYRSPQAIRADYARDPILGTARWLVASGGHTGEGLADDYVATRDRVRAQALDAAALPQLASAEEVMAPLAPRSPGLVAETAAATRFETASVTGALTLAQAINVALAAVLDALSGGPALRRGHCDQGRRVRSHARAARPVRGGEGVRHAARRDLDPRARPRLRRQRLSPAPRDPVPRVPPQRGGPAPGRGGHPAVLLTGPVPERDGDPDRRLRLPARLRRALPQRRRGGGAAGHPRARDRVAVPARRRCRDARHLRRVCARGRERLRLPGADRAVPRARPARRGGRGMVCRAERGACSVGLRAHVLRRAPISRS